MLRGLVKTGTACALTWTGASRLISFMRGRGRMPYVVGYHRVVENTAAHTATSIPAMLTSTRMLERHLDWIGRRYRFVSVDELGTRLEAGEPFEKPVAAITFDDGYRDNYEHAFPLLKRKGIPAAFFVVTDLIGTPQMQNYDRLFMLLVRAFGIWRSAPDDLIRVLLGLGIGLADIERFRHVACTPMKAVTLLLNGLPQADILRIIEALEEKVEIQAHLMEEFASMDWDMVADMHKSGMTIGSHTRTHVVMTNERPERIHEELKGSRTILESRLGAPITQFAYPDGKFDVTAVRQLKNAGYRFAYTTCSHQDSIYPLLTIPRRLLWENSSLDVLGSFSPAIMGCLANSVFDLMDPCKQEHGRVASGPMGSGEESVLVGTNAQSEDEHAVRS
jgi:peptidoglycan/xylan/chitin deacetylase (PgdA/CDA1 family)